MPSVTFRGMIGSKLSRYGTAAMVIAAADTAGNLPDADKKLVEKFAFAIKNGCEKRGGKRSEAAVACTAVALAKVKAVVQ